MVSLIPLNDDRQHELSTECWCNPDVAWHNPETGAVYPKGPLVKHNSADCREIVERLIGEGVATDKRWAIFED